MYVCSHAHSHWISCLSSRCFSGTPKYSECLQRKREIVESLENKIEVGLDRSVSQCMNSLIFGCGLEKWCQTCVCNVDVKYGKK